MINTREEMKNYALKVCVPMLEAAAERRLSGKPSVVVDTIGYIPTLLEELFRPFWGLAPILSEEDIYLNIRGEKIAVGEWLREVLVTGIDPESPFWWDKYRDSVGGHSFDFQNITEIAGLLVGMYFAKEKTWDLLTPDEQRMVADYIAKASIGLCVHTAENNHIWFPLLCLTVLERLGFEYPETPKLMREGLDRLDTMYAGGGWYSDGPFGRIDYYEAWSMHSYPLLWCLIADPEKYDYAARRKKYLERTREFLGDFIRFFDEDGMYPPFGRSLAYRFAAVCVFPLAILAGVDFDAKLAGAVTMRNVSYFVERMLMPESGIIPPGFMYESPALVENYTSSGGAYWCAKSFMCLALPAEHDFWKGTELPSDTQNYLFSPKDKRLNFMISHEKDAGVTVYNNHFQYYQFGRYCNPFNDMASCYDKFAYNSLAGFGLSTHDNVSRDNMISLSTTNGSMTSHRWGFTDLGREDGWMISVHTPFSNDPETVIKTFMKPLCGFHVRIHLVTLSREYSVSEGGFAVGLWDDYRESEAAEQGFIVKTKTLESYISTASDAKLVYCEMRPNPGMHLMAPYSAYPAYRTDPLPAGKYVFASVFGIHKLGKGSQPVVKLDGNIVYLDMEKVFEL